jgi:hypothetical protein
MKRESNPARYREMSVPHENMEALDKDLEAFLSAVGELRVKYRLQDVVVLIKTSAISNGEEGAFMSSAHMGNAMELEPLLAQALGNAQRDREEMVARALAMPKKR